MAISSAMLISFRIGGWLAGMMKVAMLQNRYCRSVFWLCGIERVCSEVDCVVVVDDCVETMK
jgi:hypothetical protein